MDVLVPPSPGVLCAMGVLTKDAQIDVSQTRIVRQGATGLGEQHAPGLEPIRETIWRPLLSDVALLSSQLRRSFSRSQLGAVPIRLVQRRRSGRLQFFALNAQE